MSKKINIILLILIALVTILIYLFCSDFFVKYIIILLIISTIYIFIKLKEKTKLKFTKKLVIASLIFSSLFTFVITKNYILDKEEVIIEPSIQAKESVGTWICGISLDGIPYDLKTILPKEKFIPYYNCLVNTDESLTKTVLTLPNFKTITFNLKNYDHGGKTNITVDEKTKTIDTYSKITVNKNYSIEKNYNLNLSLFEFFEIIIIFLILTITTLCSLKLINKNKIYLALPALLIISILNTAAYLSNIKFVFILILTLLINILLSSLFKAKIDQKYNSKFIKVSILVVSLILTFCCFGNELFLTSETPVFISLTNIIYFILLVPLSILFVFYTLYIFEKIYQLFFKNNKEVKNKNNKKLIFIFLAVFLLTFIAWMIWGISYYPGFMSFDSASLWAMSCGVETLYDSHPITYVMLLKLFCNLFANPFSVIIFQIFFSSLFIAFISSYLYKKSVNIYIIILTSIILALYPSIALMNITLWKDIPFTICLLFLSYYCYRFYVNDFEFSSKWYNYLVFCLLIMGILLFRFNGILVFMFLVIYFLILSIKRKKFKVLITLIIAYLLSKLLVFGFNTNFDIKTENIKNVQYTTIIKNFIATIYYQKKLPDGAQQIVEEIGPLDSLLQLYQGENIDNIYYGEGIKIESWYEVLRKIKTTQILSLYLENIFKNPDVFLRDKLDGMNILWNIKTPNIYNTYLIPLGIDGAVTEEQKNILKEQTNIEFNSMNIYYTSNPLATKVLEKEIKLSKIDIFSTFFWRVGIYVCVLLIFTIFLIANKKKSSLALFLPMIAYTVSWLITLNHQSFRYIYYIIFIFYFAILLGMLYNDESLNKKKK